MLLLCAAYSLITISPGMEIQDLATQFQMIIIILFFTLCYCKKTVLLSSHRNKFLYTVHYDQTYPVTNSHHKKRNKMNRHYYLRMKIISSSIKALKSNYTLTSKCNQSYAEMSNEERKHYFQSEYESNKSKYLHCDRIMSKILYGNSLNE